MTPTPNEQIRQIVNVALPRGSDFTLVNLWLGQRPQSVVIDIGANEGGFMAHWFGLGASEVHAFEPVPAVYQRLARSWGREKRAILNNFAIGETTGLVTGVQILNAHTLAKPKETGLAVALEDTGAFDMEVWKLDTYVQNKRLARVDFIKLDVDGYEGKALRGMTWVLSQFRPAVMIELSYLPYSLGDSCEAMVRHIYAMGYKLCTMAGEVCDDPLLVMEAYPWRTSFDMVMIPVEKIGNEWPRLR